MTTAKNYDQQIHKLRELLQGIDYGMFTTVDEDGSLHSCPMSISSEINSDGTLWFFIYASSHKVKEVEHYQQVNVSFSSPDCERYISISGTAQQIKDRDKMRELWKPELQTWFPKGLDEPDITLLKVNISKADYWDSRAKFKPQTISFMSYA
ncbi:MAG: pyridoxamine 5'-phosphate oxidase family protein [Desmonostoc vinosum HA7617-LM4]|jgi:general stress protein 26|nr:pyridoxamine 5'-phosphate oxidase family protein [Desmonostoc vinosum HA7617-LM4]